MKHSKPAVFLAILLCFFLLSCGKNEKNQDTSETILITEENNVMPDRINYEIDLTKPVIALTFDDGPNTTTTLQILKILEKYQVRASFFVIGNNINDDSAKVMKTAYDYGHEINNHSKTHGYMTKMTKQQIKDEYNYVDDLVYRYTGEKTKFFRPPYISVNTTVYDAIDVPFICGVGCNDWDPQVDAETRYMETVKQVKDGTIILLHDTEGNFQTVLALEKIIPHLLSEGYQFATVSELFEAKNVTANPLDTKIYTTLE